MDKINLILDILKLSLEFDSLLEDSKFCDLKKCSDEINKKIIQFEHLLKSTESTKFTEHIEPIEAIKPIEFEIVSAEIYSILDKINKVNEYAINYFIKLCNKDNKNNQNNQNNKKSKNTMILFYSDKCKYSINFFSEWEKLKEGLNGKVNMIAINCNKSNKKQICDFFKIYEYPTIKYITPTKIHDYYGEMNYGEIVSTFMLD